MCFHRSFSYYFTQKAMAAFVHFFFDKIIGGCVAEIEFDGRIQFGNIYPVGIGENPSHPGFEFKGWFFQCYGAATQIANANQQYPKKKLFHDYFYWKYKDFR
jgi:hypothetical protein